MSTAIASPERIDFQDEAMGTSVHFVAYTIQEVDAKTIRASMARAFAEMERLASVPTAAEIEQRRRLVDYRKAELDPHVAD